MSAAERPSETRRPAGGGEVLILAVDDKPANLIALERALASVPARIVKATSGEEALAVSLRQQFALAILDVQMPGMDGYELAEILLADPATARTPIIFVTAAYSDEAHLFKGYGAGAVDYMVKPYDPAILVSKVNVFLELARHRFGLEEAVEERTRALRASEARYRTLFETMAQGVVYQDASGRIIESNPAAQRILGLLAPELLARSSSDTAWGAVRADGSDFPGDQHPAMEALRTGKPVRDVLMGLRRPSDGSDVWINVDAIPQYRPGDSVPYQVYTTFSDITARREAERKVSASERALRTVFESIEDGILVVDAESFALQLANGAMGRLLGRAPPLHPGSPLAELLRPEHLGRLRAQVGLRQDEPSSILDLSIRRSDGSEAVVDILLAPIDLRGRRCLLIVFRDMTERRREERERERLQAELHQAQRMESIGALAGGVAHDFNNLLSVILGYVGLAIDSEDTSPTTREDLVEVKKAGERSAELTRQLLAFGRKQVLQRVPIDLNHIALGVEKMLRRIVGEDIALSFELAESLWVVRADPGQIEQIVMNLAVNARDAMPHGGTLRVVTENIAADRDLRRRHPEIAEGGYVRFSIVDTGHGMDASTLARIFEPFFTTKARDKGTGLGLSTVYGIVKQSEGYVFCESEVGRGTAFRVYLPRVEGVAPVSVRPAPPDGQIRGGTETVLVVEDADPVRSLAARALDAAGYRVLTAIDGVDALRTSEAWAAPIDLILTDVVMPRMGGEELATRLAGARPEARILFMSGYMGSMFRREGSGEPLPNFVEKPFRVDDLLRKVRATLDAAVVLP
jgi:two-component system cell cycle sensor histidine kinase/response regulator CckA